MYAAAEPTNWLTLLIAIGAILGGMGYATGQFLSSRRKGVADALSTALDEVAAMRLRGDRLHEEMAAMKAKYDAEMGALRARLTALEQENHTLRETLRSGGALAPEFRDTMFELLHQHEEKTDTYLTALEARMVAAAGELASKTDATAATLAIKVESTAESLASKLDIIQRRLEEKVTAIDRAVNSKAPGAKSIGKEVTEIHDALPKD